MALLSRGNWPTCNSFCFRISPLTQLRVSLLHDTQRSQSTQIRQNALDNLPIKKLGSDDGASNTPAAMRTMQTRTGRTRPCAIQAVHTCPRVYRRSSYTTIHLHSASADRDALEPALDPIAAVSPSMRCSRRHDGSNRSASLANMAPLLCLLETTAAPKGMLGLIQNC